MNLKSIRVYTHEVQGILDGRQSQLRRIVKKDLDHQCWIGNGEGYESAPPSWSKEALKSGLLWCANCGHHAMSPVKCPYGKPGDILWVRETWCKVIDQDEATPGYLYKADEDPTGQFSGYRWKPSIHMAQSAARIFLRITDIRVERLQDITEEDAISEGILPLLQSRMQLAMDGQLYRDYTKKPELFNEGLRPVQSFQSLWQSINGPDSWQPNPWTWVVSFERIDKPE